MVVALVQMGMRHRNSVTAHIKAVSKKGTVEFHGNSFTLNAHFDLNLNDSEAVSAAPLYLLLLLFFNSIG